MANKGEQSRTTAGQDDSFEALLKQAAHVSGPVPTGASSSSVLPVGATLSGGRLSVSRRIGEGGMGVVYEVFDSERKAPVALKTLNRLDAGSVYRLKNEFRALADVTHPNLVRLHELFAQDASWFFTMELVDGERFDHWVRPDDALDEARLRAALTQLVAGVSAIHSAGKLHRDLKPSNVLVTPEGRVVVLDFGLAVDPELGGVGQTVAEDSVSGTPAYMAPEQAAGKPATQASDFYALGVMLFEALTGRLPFEGRSGEMLAAKQTRDAPSASAVWKRAPVDLDTVCTQLLSREPSARPDAARLRDAIGAAHGLAEASSSSRSSIPPGAPLELLGREAELAVLRRAYQSTLSGQPVVLFVSGESGMGKSALCEAFLSELRAQGRAVVLSGRCYERENVPYKGFDVLIDELSRHLRRLPAHEAAAVLPREVFALARLFPVLDRVQVVADAPKKQLPDPQDLQRRAFAAFGELMGRIRDRQPLVVFIDDLQWTDQDSVRFMRSLLLNPESVPALLIVAHRSEGAEDNALLQSVLQAASDNRALLPRTLAVEPLAEDALEALVLKLLPKFGSMDAARTLAREAQGSPFFAAELARAALLRRKDDPPPSLGDAIAAHVGSLSSEARRLLSVLALAGQPLSPSVAIQAAGLGDGHAQLDVLRAEQLIRVALDADGARMVECYHDKIRELMSAGLDALLVRELALGLSHALLAQPHADPELLTRCLETAELPLQAAEHAAQGADRALQALAFDRASRLYEKALALGRFDPTRVQALRAGRAEALAQTGRGEVAAEAYLEARQGATEEQAYELTRKAAEQYLLCGRLDHGRRLLHEAARPLGVSMPESSAAAFASLIWSRARLRLRGWSFVARENQDALTLRKLEALRSATHCLACSDQLRAADFSARWTQLALDCGHAVELARALAWEMLFAAVLGTPAPQAEPMAELAERLCDQTGDTLGRMWLHYGRGIYLQTARGKPELALADFDRALALILANPHPTASYDRPWFQYWRSSSLMYQGRLIEAGVLAQAQLEEAWARGDLTIMTFLTMIACITLLAAGRVQQAERACERACAAWQSDEVTVQDFMLLGARTLPTLYRGASLESWRGVQPALDRFRGSLFGRVPFRGVIDAASCGWAAAAARQTTDEAERRALLREAVRSAKRARPGKSGGGVTGCPRAVLPCVLGQRETAITALREWLEVPGLAPLGIQLARRRLGVLLGDDEGHTLVADADAFLSSAGVVDPEHFVAMLMPGVEIEEANR